jgi:putative colanic acid biosynthesis UDP-glucose lipid carrier transferase
MDATIRSLPIGSTTRTLSGVIAALLDPVLIIAVLVVSTRLHGGVYDGPELLLSLLVFAITFPSPVRRFTGLRQLITDVFYTWASACFVLLFFGYAGRFFGHFEPGTLAAWALAVPPVLVLGRVAFDRVVRSLTAERGRRAIVVGVNPLARSLVSRMAQASHLGLRFEGFFDDRGPARLEGEAQTPVVGRLE